MFAVKVLPKYSINFTSNPERERKLRRLRELERMREQLRREALQRAREEVLRQKLSPECQHDSIELREELKKIDETKDPVMMLIVANNMKRFMPKAGILNAKQQTNLVEGIKEVITMAVQNGDMSKFDEDDKFAIGEMVQMIKASDSTDFGISVKLQALVDKLNKKKLNLGFIPPVQVRELESQVQKAIKH